MDYDEAVALYEEGLKALQRHEFGRSAELLRQVLERYPDERELHERVRLYLRVCERQVQPKAPQPATPSELLYAATLALNAGRVEEALKHLEGVSREDPTNDHALYMQAAARAQRGERQTALIYLRRAIGLNAENRSLARNDADFEGLRQDPEFRALLEAPSATKRRPRSRQTR